MLIIVSQANELPCQSELSQRFFLPMSEPSCRKGHMNVTHAMSSDLCRWLNFTVILGGLAVGLLNFGDKIGRISAALFTVVAMMTMLYALLTYHWRANAIRKRGSGPYDDRFGPTMLCIFLLAAVVTNFALRVFK